MKQLLLRIYMKLTSWHLCNFISDTTHTRILWWLKMPYRLHLDHPKTYNEKIQWLKLNIHNPLFPTLVDKYAVRHFIEQQIGSTYLIPLLGKYDSFDAIDFSTLPEQFVLKCNHGSHCSMICLDKSQFNTKIARKNFNKWMKTNWHWYFREWPYKTVHPVILCEKFMSNNGDVPEDYKVFCSDGLPQVIRVDKDRFENVTFNFYTRDWKRSDILMGPLSNEPTPRPSCLDEMLKLSTQLSANIKHVRVDWYVIQNRLYFGEMTFFNAAGMDTDFTTYEDDLKLGHLVRLD